MGIYCVEKWVWDNDSNDQTEQFSEIVVYDLGWFHACALADKLWLKSEPCNDEYHVELQPEMIVPEDTPKNEMFVYLDNLRESGVTNMFGAAPYLADAFGLSTKEASTMLHEWMTTFSDRHPED